MGAAVPFLIQVGISVGASVASSLLAPKPKLSPVDKGRFDDIRFTTAEEGAFKPMCFGQRVRLAGNMIWGTVTREFVTRTEGRSGGKGGGGGQQPTPPTNTFTYKKSFAFHVCSTPVKTYRRITENLETIYNNVGSDLIEDFFEAENHTVGGGAVVVTDGQCSNGRAVRLSATDHFVEIAAPALFAGLHTVSIFYKASGPSQVNVSANGGAESAVSLPKTTSTPASVTTTLLLRRGQNAVRLRGGTATADIDRVYVSGTGEIPGPPDDPELPIRGREVTGLIDLDATFPANLNNPTPYYNVVQGFDANGYFEGHMTAGGQARFELFAGKETQPQSAIIVAREGAAETPAWRDDSYFVTEDYLLKEGQLGNFIFEIEPEIQRLDEILLYLYTLEEKVAAADCDFSALSDIICSGLILDHRAPLSEWVTALESWYNFDTVPRGGKIVAVKRGGAVTTRLYERELRAHLYGQERPRAAVAVTHEDPIDLPESVDVLYLDPSPSKDFHTGNQTVRKQVGFSFDADTLSFPIVGDADTAQAVGQRFLDARHLAAKPATLVCGFGKRHLIPTDIVEVELENGTLHTYRLVQKQADLQSMVRFRGVPERPSIYSQTGVGVRGRGPDVIIVRPPANSLFAQADVPPLRTAERGRLGRYMGGCALAGGVWRGAGAFKTTDAGERVRVTAFDTEATMGVALTALPDWSNPDVDDTTSTVDFGLYHGTLESITAGEFQNNAELNVLVVIKTDGTGEVIRYQTATPLALVAGEPYETKVRLSTFKRGVNHTLHAMTGHAVGDLVLQPDTAVKFIEEPVEDLDKPREWRLVSAGQAVEDAAPKTTTLRGHSYRPPELKRLGGLRNASTNDLFLDWLPFEEGGQQEYALRFFAVGSQTPAREVFLKVAGIDQLQWKRDDQIADGTPVISAGTCSSISAVGSDGTVSTTGSTTDFCRYVSQELWGDLIFHFQADSRATPQLIQIVAAAPRPCVIDTTANTVRIPKNDLEIYNGQTCQFRLVPGGGGSLPGGVANEDAAYTVANFDGIDTFQVLSGGSVLDLTSAGSGVRAAIGSGAAHLETTKSGSDIFIRPEAADTLKRPVVSGESYAIEMSARQARYFIPFTSDVRDPRFNSGSVRLPQPFRISAMLGGLDGVAQAIVAPRVVYRRPNAFTYYRTMQNADFAGAPPASILCEVRQVSYIGSTRVEGLPKYITL